MEALYDQAKSARAARAQIRSGELKGHTSGLAPGHVQANLVVLPVAYADDFLRFAQRNPKPCPILGVSEAGSPHLPALGADIDLRTDLTGYNVYRQGELVESIDDLTHLWQDDFVWFAIGCSFSFEEALLADGIALRHIARNQNVPMYRTSIPTVAAGPFSGPLVVSMRPMKASDAIRAIQITSRFPNVHGAPVHIGDPTLIGISDIAKPDYGDSTEIAHDELPVFWACGVTPQAALKAAKPPICITHTPGCMLITDLFNSRLSTF